MAVVLEFGEMLFGGRFFFCSLANVHEFNLHYANHTPILSAAVKLHMNIIILISDV